MKFSSNEEIVKYVTNLFLSVKTWREPYERRWRRFYRLYRNYRNVTLNYYKSNIFVPYIFALVENIVPRMLGTIFNVHPIISVQPRNAENANLAQLLEKLLAYQLDDERVEFFYKMQEFFKEMCIYGSAFLKIIPKFTGDELEFLDYIDVEPIDLFNVFPDYRAKSVHRMKYLMQLAYMELEDLEKLEDSGFFTNVDEVKTLLASPSEIDFAKRQRLGDIGILDEYGFDPERKIVEIIEYWDKEYIYTVGGRRILLKKEENPFKGFLPFIMGKYIPVQHELYGIGIPEVCESLQLELNAIRNQRMDNVNLILNRMFIANKYADIDFDSLVSYPGNVILSSDVNAIKPLITPDVTKSAYLEENIVKADMDMVSGDYAYSRGEPPIRKETATTVVRLQQASNIRFDAIVKFIEFTVLRQIAKMFIRLNYSFLSPDDFATIVGPEEYMQKNGDAFYAQSIDEILKQYHFQPMGSSVTAIKEIRVQQIMQAYQILHNDPLINQYKLRELLLDALEIKNKSELLINPQNLQTPGMDLSQLMGQEQSKLLPQTVSEGVKPGRKPIPPEEQFAKLLKIIGGASVKEGQPPGIQPMTSPVETGEVLEVEEGI